MEVIDPTCAPDIFASALYKAENIGGGNFRFTFIVAREDGPTVVTRLVLNVDAIGPAICMAAKAIGMAMLPGNVTVTCH